MLTFVICFFHIYHITNQLKVGLVLHHNKDLLTTFPEPVCPRKFPFPKYILKNFTST